MVVPVSRLAQLKEEIMALQRKVDQALESLDVSQRKPFEQKIAEVKAQNSFLEVALGANNLKEADHRVKNNLLKEEEWISQNNLKENKYPEKWYCPLSKRLMLDPVIAFNGFTYERTSIREPNAAHKLPPNLALYSEIESVLKPKLEQQIKDLKNLLNQLRNLQWVSDPAYKGEEENRKRNRNGDSIPILPLPSEFSSLLQAKFPISRELGPLSLPEPDPENNVLLAEEAQEWRELPPQRAAMFHLSMPSSSSSRMPNPMGFKEEKKEEEDIFLLPLYPKASAASSSAMIPRASKSFFSSKKMPILLKPKREEEEDIPVLPPYPEVSASSSRIMAPNLSRSSSSSSLMASRANIPSIFSSLYRQNDEQSAALSPSPSSRPLPSEVDRYLALKTLYDKLNALLLARELNSLKYGKLIGNIVSLSGKISAEMQKYGDIDVPSSAPIDIEQVIPQYQNVEKAMQNCLQKLKARYPDATYTHIYTPTYKFSFVFGNFESEAFSPQRMKDVPQSVDSSFFSGIRKDDGKRLQEEIDSLGIPGTVDSAILHSYVSDCATIKGVRVIFECDNARVWNIAAAIEDIRQEFLGTLDQRPVPVPVKSFFR